MKRYTYAFLRDYFSARGLTLTRRSAPFAPEQKYQLTNGKHTEWFANLDEVRARALLG